MPRSIGFSDLIGFGSSKIGMELKAIETNNGSAIQLNTPWHHIKLISYLSTIKPNGLRLKCFMKHFKPTYTGLSGDR